MARDSSGPKNEPQYSAVGVPADAADLSEVATFAAKVGNRRAEAGTVRTVLVGADIWDGLEVRDKTDGHLYESFGGSWVDRDTATPLLNPGVGATQGPVNVGVTSFTVYSGTFVLTAGDRVLIVFDTTAQSTGATSAGFVWVTLNGVQLGVKKRVQNLGVANAPVPVFRIAKGFATAGTNTVQVLASTDSGSSAAIYYNAPTIEVWSD